MFERNIFSGVICVLIFQLTYINILSPCALVKGNKNEKNSKNKRDVCLRYKKLRKQTPISIITEKKNEKFCVGWS